MYRLVKRFPDVTLIYNLSMGEIPTVSSISICILCILLLYFLTYSFAWSKHVVAFIFAITKVVFLRVTFLLLRIPYISIIIVKTFCSCIGLCCYVFVVPRRGSFNKEIRSNY